MEQLLFLPNNTVISICYNTLGFFAPLEQPAYASYYSVATPIIHCFSERRPAWFLLRLLLDQDYSPQQLDACDCGFCDVSWLLAASLRRCGHLCSLLWSWRRDDASLLFVPWQSRGDQIVWPFCP
jgi:hypothetical protein